MRWLRCAMGALVGVAWAATAAAGASRVPEILLRQGDGGGRVRAIIRLAVPTVPEGRLADREAVLGQRRAIRAGHDRVRSALRGHAHRVVHEFRTVPFMTVEVDGHGLGALAASPAVIAVQPDYLLAPTLPASVPLIDGDLAWGQGFEGKDSVVAILDTGVDAAHSFLAGRVVEEACFSSGGDCPNGGTMQIGPGSAAPCTYASGCSHGTHVAGIAAGRGTTFSGVARGAHIIAVQVFSMFTGSICGSGGGPCPLAFTSDIIAGLEHVYELRDQYGIAAANLSLGGGIYTSQSACDADNPGFKAAIDLLRSVGIATVIAAGNSGSSTGLASPGCISSAVSVGATTKLDAVASYSNSAPFLSLLAPGSSIQSSVPGGGFATLSGTSMATPHVTGAWAVAKQKNPMMGVGGILAALQASGVLITDSRNGLSKPRIDVDGALAQFPQAVAVAVTKSGTGTGTVAMDGTGGQVPNTATCGATCTRLFDSGTAVTLTAAADAGSAFAGWSGSGLSCPGTGPCSFTLSADVTITATFVQQRTVTVTKTGSGSGTVTLTGTAAGAPATATCDPTCAPAFDSGTPVTLSATPAAGSTFTGWSGACAGTGPCTLTLTADTAVTATFAAGNPVPVLTALAPSSASAGGTALTLALTGSAFVPASVVRWNGADRPTTFVSSTQLTAAIPATDLAAAGTAQVTVFTPAPGGGTSAALAFTITNPAPSALPTVTIAATTPTAAEAGPTPGAFTLTRTGPTTSPLTVAYTVSGSATPGSDYAALGPAVTFPAGASTVTLPVAPVDDALPEGSETVTVTLSPDPAYVVGSPGSATVTIQDDDAPGLLFADDFNRPDSTTLGPGWAEEAGDWTIAGQQLTVTAPAGTGAFLRTAAALSQADYQVQSRLTPVTGGFGGLLARFVDQNNHYLLWLRVDARTVTLWRVKGGFFTALGSSYTPPGGLALGHTYALRLTVQGTQITGEFSPDGGTTWALVASAADSTHAGPGTAGYRAYGGTLRADDFTVRAP